MDSSIATARSTTKSVVQKHFLSLQPCEIWCLLRRQTGFHSTVYDCIRAALDNPETTCGLYAADGDCYDVFQCLFWPVIMDCHRIDLRTLVFKHDFGDARHLDELPLELRGQVVSVRMRVNRSIRDYPMIPKLTREQLIEIEERVKNIFEYLDDDLRGEYRALSDITETDQIQLREQSILFQEPGDPDLGSAGVYNHWPAGRGFAANENGSFIVWINEEDHVSLIAQSNDGNLIGTYERLVRAANHLNQLVDFQQHPRLGYLNVSALNIGTALRIAVQIQLLHPERLNQLTELCKQLDLHLESTTNSAVVSLSNMIRLGRTEFHIVRSMWNSIGQIIARDRQE